MGDVYQAFDPVLGRTVALKTIKPDSHDPSLLERLEIEARVCGQLHHDNIVVVHDFQKQADGIFIAMEYLEGRTLAQAIREDDLSLGEKLSILSDILAALEHAHHQHVLHRDIKPANVLLLPSGIAKLVDFGLARDNKVASITVTGTVMGTVAYMSPEQMKCLALDARSDLYSVGALAYELLTGRPAFAADTMTAVMLKVLSEAPPPMETGRSGVPPELEAIVRRALAKSPSERYASASELRNALLAVAARLSTAAAGTGTLLAPSRSGAASSHHATAGSGAGDSLAWLHRLSPSPVPAPPSPRSNGEPSRDPVLPSSAAPGGTVSNSPVVRRYAVWAIAGAAVLGVAIALVWGLTFQPAVHPTLGSGDGQSAGGGTPISVPRGGDSDVSSQHAVAGDVTGTTTGRIDVPPPGGSGGDVPFSIDPRPVSTGPRDGATQQPSTRAGAQVDGHSTHLTQNQAPAGLSITSAGIVAGASDELSADLAGRVRRVVAADRLARLGQVQVVLKMSTRPSGFQAGGLTATYEVTVTTASGAHHISGNALEFSELAVRNAVLEKATEDVAKLLPELAP
jgi:serine/threonine-protein kinase